MSESRLNAVAILDAIPEGELNTARRLREDIEAVAASLEFGPVVRYFRIDTIACLSKCLESLQKGLRESGIVPMLHFEGHGYADESGIVTAAGEPCPWEQLKELITPLNVSMRLNLMVVLAACYGGSFTRAIRTTERAPVWGLIGPTRTITVGQIQGDFGAFYRTFFQTSSGSMAIQALNANAPQNLYYSISAETFFYQVWKGYKRAYCSKHALDERARGIYRELKAKGSPQSPSIGQLKRKLQAEEPAIFDRFRDIFFMFDLYPSNQARFPITYREAEEFCRS